MLNLNIFRPRIPETQHDWDAFWEIMNMYGYKQPNTEAASYETLLKFYRDAENFFRNINPIGLPFDVSSMVSTLKNIADLMEAQMADFNEKARVAKREAQIKRRPLRRTIKNARLELSLNARQQRIKQRRY